jgi:hypothetical protein
VQSSPIEYKGRFEMILYNTFYWFYIFLKIGSVPTKISGSVSKVLICSRIYFVLIFFFSLVPYWREAVRGQHRNSTAEGPFLPRRSGRFLVKGYITKNVKRSVPDP